MNLFTRRSDDREKWGGRLPPGQKATEGWPILHYGSIPRIEVSDWALELSGLVEKEVSLSWGEFQALGNAVAENDIHCVTGWSKFDNTWEGVSVPDVLELAGVTKAANHLMVHCYGGYSTNLSLRDLDRPENLFATSHNGEPLSREHGWPVRLVVPHLYFWKSAKWVNRLEFIAEERPGFWENYGYHLRGDPFKEERYG